MNLRPEQERKGRKEVMSSIEIKWYRFKGGRGTKRKKEPYGGVEQNKPSYCFYSQNRNGKEEGKLWMSLMQPNILLVWI